MLFRHCSESPDFIRATLCSVTRCGRASKLRCPGHGKQRGAAFGVVAETSVGCAVGRFGIVLVEEVVQFQVEGHFLAGLPCAAQAEQAVTTQLTGVVGIVIAPADCAPTGADSKLTELAIQ